MDTVIYNNHDLSEVIKINEVRITPACAGKTQNIYLKSLVSWDHLRECGKNLIEKASGLRTPGSPPRVREKSNLLCFNQNLIGITPACAGKTLDNCLRD